VIFLAATIRYVGTVLQIMKRTINRSSVLTKQLTQRGNAVGGFEANILRKINFTPSSCSPMQEVVGAFDSRWDTARYH